MGTRRRRMGRIFRQAVYERREIRCAERPELPDPRKTPRLIYTAPDLLPLPPCVDVVQVNEIIGRQVYIST